MYIHMLFLYHTHVEDQDDIHPPRQMEYLELFLDSIV